MTDFLISRLEQEMKKQGFNYKSLSLAAGLGETGVRDIITRRARNPRRDTLQKIAAQLGKPLSYFLAENDETKVRLVGEIAAGTKLAAQALSHVGEKTPSAPVEMVEGPPEPGYRNLVAVRVKGDELLPFMPAYTLIYYSASGDTQEDCLDNLCVIQPKKGPALVKTLRRGMLYGTYHLEGFKGDMIENAEIEWCARIRFIRLP